MNSRDETDRQTDSYTDIATTRLNMPRADSVKICHTDNKRPSCSCGIHEYRLWVQVFNMSPSLYHGPSRYQECISIPCVHACTMSQGPYHESKSVPWVKVYTMSPCLYHEANDTFRSNVGIRYVKKQAVKGYIKVQGWQRVLKGPRLAKGI